MPCFYKKMFNAYPDTDEVQFSITSLIQKCLFDFTFSVSTMCVSANLNFVSIHHITKSQIFPTCCIFAPEPFYI